MSPNDLPAGSGVSKAGLDQEALRSLIDDPHVRLQTSATDMVDPFLARIETWQPLVNAFVTLTADRARADATRVDNARAAGHPLKPLDGMVVAVKDDIDVAGVRCTVGTPFYADRVPAADAVVATRLRDAGAVLVGKTGLHEWAYGATSNNPHYGAIRNPWDLSRSPGGSSGGSAAAVASDLCVGSLGSDAGGSVRVPASLTGVTGFRPTLGAVSSRGSHPICFSLETIGPIARSVRDVAALFAVVSGYDPVDPHSHQGSDENPLDRLDAGIAGARIGLLQGYFLEGLDGEVDHAVRLAADEFAALGAHVTEVSLTRAAAAYHATCEVMIRAEALAIHEERLAAHPEMFGDDVRRRLELGREVTGVEFARAAEAVRLWRAEVRELFQHVDLVVCATAPDPAPLIEGAETIATTQRLTRMAFPLSAAELPAISLPCGLTKSGLPIGVMVAAAPWRDSLTLRAGFAFQERTHWHLQRPPEPSLAKTKNGQMGAVDAR